MVKPEILQFVNNLKVITLKLKKYNYFLEFFLSQRWNKLPRKPTNILKVGTRTNYLP